MTFDPGQVSSLLRQGGQYAAGAVSVFVLLGSIDADAAKNAVAAIGEIVDGLSHATAGISKLLVIAGPIAGGLIAKFAFLNASSKSKVEAVKAIAADPTQPQSHDAKEAIKAAASTLPNTLVVAPAPGIDPTALAAKVASIPETGTVLAAPAIAAATISGKVVAAPGAA